MKWGIGTPIIFTTFLRSYRDVRLRITGLREENQGADDRDIVYIPAGIRSKHEKMEKSNMGV